MPIAPRRAFTVPLPGRPPSSSARARWSWACSTSPPIRSPTAASRSIPAAPSSWRWRWQAAGADIIDVGAESTRPGAAPDRCRGGVAPPAARPAADWRWRLQVPVSVDTYRAETARRALDEGVAIVNDISGLRYDAALGAVVAARGAALVLMHTRGRSRDMYARGDVRRRRRRGRAGTAAQRRARGRGRRGVGSADRRSGSGLREAREHSLPSLAALDRFAALGRPDSRRAVPQVVSDDRPTGARPPPTSVTGRRLRPSTAAVLGGAHIVRVHRRGGDGAGGARRRRGPRRMRNAPPEPA